MRRTRAKRTGVLLCASGNWIPQWPNARCAAARQGKQVQLKSKTLTKTDIPAYLTKPVKEISIQLLRNAVVHGIETPSARHSAGKSDTGR